MYIYEPIYIWAHIIYEPIMAPFSVANFTEILLLVIITKYVCDIGSGSAMLVYFGPGSVDLHKFFKEFNGIAKHSERVVDSNYWASLNRHEC